MRARLSTPLPLTTPIGAVVLVVAVALVVACGPTVVPSASTAAVPSPSPVSSTDPGGSLPSGALPGTSGATLPPPSGEPGASATSGAGPVTPASVDPFTPPPVMAPQDDDVCLALVARNEVETALGMAVGDISAQGTDPNFGLTCTYPAAGGQLLLTTTTEDPVSAFESELALATGYGQAPQTLEGVGDQAFYAAATAEAPEQIVFTKGPVVVRLWNQTTATVGSVSFTTLATGAAAAIRAEIPPAP